MIHYEGRVFRPPSEAYSLLVQVTIGCSHNKCTFCDMYKEKQFRIRPLEEILEDIDMAREYYGPNLRRVFLMDGDEYHGFCHGAYFNTFWLSGMTCYVSSIITNEDERGKGNGVKLMDHAKELAKERGCKALVLDSGMPRTQAHRFYEKIGYVAYGDQYLDEGYPHIPFVKYL